MAEEQVRSRTRLVRQLLQSCFRPNRSLFICSRSSVSRFKIGEPVHQITYNLQMPWPKSRFGTLSCSDIVASSFVIFPSDQTTTKSRKQTRREPELCFKHLSNFELRYQLVQSRAHVGRAFLIGHCSAHSKVTLYLCRDITAKQNFSHLSSQLFYFSVHFLSSLEHGLSWP